MVHLDVSMLDRQCFMKTLNDLTQLLASQRLLRRLDEVHLLDSSGNIIMSNVCIDLESMKFVPPPDEAFDKIIKWETYKNC